MRLINFIYLFIYFNPSGCLIIHFLMKFRPIFLQNLIKLGCQFVGRSSVAECTPTEAQLGWNWGTLLCPHWHTVFRGKPSPFRSSGLVGGCFWGQFVGRSSDSTGPRIYWFSPFPRLKTGLSRGHFIGRSSVQPGLHEGRVLPVLTGQVRFRGSASKWVSLWTSPFRTGTGDGLLG